MQTLSPTTPAIIFVDPQDPSEKFWWPAIIVDPSEFDQFFSIMGEPIPVNNDILVCYFEDASYSAVKQSEITIFDRNSEPFITYITNKMFLKTKGAKYLLSYINENKIPNKFKWLKVKQKKNKKRQNNEGGVFKKIIIERAMKEFKDA